MGLFGMFKKKSKAEKTPSDAEVSEIESSQAQQEPIREPSIQSSPEEDLSKVVVKVDPVVHELKSAQVK